VRTAVLSGNRVRPHSCWPALWCRISLIAALALAGSCWLLAAGMPITPEDVAAGHATRHVLVKFNVGLGERLLKAQATDPLKMLASALALPETSRLEEPPVSRLMRRRRADRGFAAVESAVELGGFFYLHLPVGMQVGECLRTLKSHPLLEYAEPDRVGRAFRTIPNDFYFRSQWHHSNQVSASFTRAVLCTPEAWDITQGSTNIVVGVLDSGLDLSTSSAQQEFSGRVLAGYNFVDDNDDLSDPNPYSHGTCVSGILGANANNHILGAGIDWNCRLLPIKVINTNNYVVESWVAQGVDYAVAQGAKVINFSGGADQDGGITLGRAISNAIAHGAIFVCASGNSGSGLLPFPASYAPAIAVGASDELDHRATFSNYGPQLDLVAPGVNILSIASAGGGTSYAAPMVSGICSLMAAVRPDITQDQALTLLGAGAQDQLGDAPGRTGGDGTDTPGWDEHHGWGRVNAYFSLLLATTRIDQVNPLADGRLELSWKSPINASTNQPFRVEFTTPLTSTWTRVTGGVFRYEGYRTWWTEPDPPLTASADRFYRVKIVLE
jgi:hypothetical protein